MNTTMHAKDLKTLFPEHKHTRQPLNTEQRRVYGCACTGVPHPVTGMAVPPSSPTTHPLSVWLPRPQTQPSLKRWKLQTGSCPSDKKWDATHFIDWSRCPGHREGYTREWVGMPSSLDSCENLPLGVAHTDFTLFDNELASSGSLHSGPLWEGQSTRSVALAVSALPLS